MKYISIPCYRKALTIKHCNCRLVRLVQLRTPNSTLKPTRRMLDCDRRYERVLRTSIL